MSLLNQPTFPANMFRTRSIPLSGEYLSAKGIPSRLEHSTALRLKDCVEARHNWGKDWANPKYGKKK